MTALAMDESEVPNGSRYAEVALRELDDNEIDHVSGGPGAAIIVVAVVVVVVVVGLLAIGYFGEHNRDNQETK